MKTSRKRILTGKSSSEAVLFICALALLFFLSGPHPASAHEGNHDDTVTVDQVDPANEDNVRDFVLHIRAHVDELPPGSIGAFVGFKNLSSIDGGDWRSDTTYVIRLRKDGTLIHQPHQPLAENGSLYDFEDDEGTRVVERLIRLAGENEDGGCLNYVLNGSQRVSCAVEFFHPVFRETPRPFKEILIAGLHHDFEDVSFAKATCPYYVPGITAAEVVNEETLKQFVQEFIDYFLEQRKRLGGAGVIGLRHCWRALPWKHGSIYMFFMPENLVVGFNGNTPELESKTLDLEDRNGVNVGDLILKEVNDPDSDGFVDYLWDDPTTTDDDVDLETCPDGPQTCAPGTSPKRTYVQKVPSELTGTSSLIFGSGIYLEDDDGGCAIAGVGNTPRGTVFSLFLIVSVLFSAALWKNRSKEKQATRKKKVFTQNAVAAFFVCASALLVLFSAAGTAGAHENDHGDSVTAGDVTVADQGKMLEFVRHAKAHWESIDNPNKNIEFERSITEEGDWKNGTIYLMVIDEEGTIFTHADDPEAQNGTLIHYSGEGQARRGDLHPEVTSLIEASGTEGGGCVHYGPEVGDEHVEGDEHEEGEHGMERTACAVKFEHPTWKTELILIAGYHHEHEEDDDSEVSFDEINCPFFTKPIDEKPFITQGRTANEVVDSDTLKEFVENFRDHFQEQVEENSQSPAQLARVRNCWRISPWRHKGIYVFIMTEGNLVFFNGNGPHLENRSFDVRDDNECDIGNEVIRVANGQDRQCRDLGLLPEDPGGFVEYLWDDPTDDVPPRIEEGRAPGDVPKLSYVVTYSHPDFLGGEELIIGSGLHPEAGGDNGCAVAGAGGTAKGALFSLFLVASVLFSAVSWKGRSKGRS